MLRIIQKPANNEIYQIQVWVEHLVCNVWCDADKSRCSSKLNAECKLLYGKFGWFKKDINRIYSKCKLLTKRERNKIHAAFVRNNNIEGLCNGSVKPIYLENLPAVVEEEMKPLFVKLYEVLLERKSVPGTKKEYYKAIQEENNFANCPCCGYVPFENIFSPVREDLDHFFPKAHYPFASVNFNNLSPLCNKCNSDFKGDTDPIKNKKNTFYTYQTIQPQINIEVILHNDFLNHIQDVLVNNLKDKPDNKLVQINLSGKEQNKINSWDNLYNIKIRYKDRVETFTYSVLRRLKVKESRLKNGYSDAIDVDVEECKSDIFVHEHFIQIPFLNSLRLLLT